MSAKGILLEVNNLKKYFPVTRGILGREVGQVKAVDGVSFHIGRGETYGLLGPNGAGKTTIVRLLTTLLRLDGGRALVDGIDVATEPGHVRARIGLTGQYAAVEERLTARENLDLIGRLYQLGAGVEARGQLS